MTAKTTLLLSPQNLVAPLKFVSGGLALDYVVDHVDREVELLFDDIDSGIAVLSRLESRRPSRCVINPSWLQPSELLDILETTQREVPNEERDNVSYGLPAERYDGNWKRVEDDADHGRSEGQFAVIVCFDGEVPVGYASVDLSLNYVPGDCYLRTALEFIFVAPARRGQGYGLDLSVACGIAIQKLIHAAYLSVKAGSTLGVVVHADLTSTGGEKFARHIANCAEIALDLIFEMRRRRSLVKGRVEFDAGW